MKKYTPAQLKKAIVGAVALLVSTAVAGLGSHLFPAAWEPWINLLITVAGTYGIFKVPNALVSTVSVNPPVVDNTQP